MRACLPVCALMLFAGMSSCDASREKTGMYKDSPMAPEAAVHWPDARLFADTILGETVSLYRLKNRNGMSALLTNYGARMVGCLVPDRHGKMVDVVSGFSSLRGYLLSGEKYYGAIVGRYANRIAGARFTLDGKEYALQANDGPNQLHGGPNGFHNRVWETEQADSQRVVFSLRSPDGEEGYPGHLEVSVAYRLTDENELVMEYSMQTDRRTVANVTNHNFWNLNGEASGTVNGHLLQVMADCYTPVDSTLIPTGIAAVAGTPFDFTRPTRIGERLGEKNLQLRYGKGYDHNFVLRAPRGSSSERLAAVVVGDLTGVSMTIFTDQPGLQFYGGNFMKGENLLKNGRRDAYRNAFCLETQHFPDSPNQSSFPSAVLEPGIGYRSQTRHVFAVEK